MFHCGLALGECDISKHDTSRFKNSCTIGLASLAFCYSHAKDMCSPLASEEDDGHMEQSQPTDTRASPAQLQTYEWVQSSPAKSFPDDLIPSDELEINIFLICHGVLGKFVTQHYFSSWYKSKPKYFVISLQKNGTSNFSLNFIFLCLHLFSGFPSGSEKVTSLLWAKTVGCKNAFCFGDLQASTLW